MSVDFLHYRRVRCSGLFCLIQYLGLVSPRDRGLSLAQSPGKFPLLGTELPGAFRLYNHLPWTRVREHSEISPFFMWMPTDTKRPWGALHSAFQMNSLSASENRAISEHVSLVILGSLGSMMLSPYRSLFHANISSTQLKVLINILSKCKQQKGHPKAASLEISFSFCF